MSVGKWTAEKGRLDRVALLYVLCGIPGIVAFCWVLFGLVHACGVPA
jgi:hypothetical protein